MGAISKKGVEDFSKGVFTSLLLGEWSMRWTTCNGGLCLRKGKRILIPERMIGQYPWAAKEYVLHEVAHIFTADRFHGSDFYAHYVRLVRRFMVLEERGRLRAVASLPAGGVRRFRSRRELEAFMGRGKYLVITIGRSDRAAAEECQAMGRNISRTGGGDIGPTR